MEIPVYASTGAFVTRANGRNFHLIPRIAPLLDCDGLEFMMYESWAGQEAEIAAELRDSGVRFPSMHLDKRIGEALSTEGMAARDEVLSIMKRDLRTAAAIGSKLLVLHFWGGPPEDERFDETKALYPTLDAMAKDAGLTLAVENVARNNDLALNRLKALRALCPDLSVTYDTKMAQLKGENELLRAPENRWLFAEGHVKHLHVNDTDMEHIAGGRMPILHIGDGCVRFDAFFQLVREAAFSGSAVVESTSTRPDGSVDTDKMNQSLRRVREALNGR